MTASRVIIFNARRGSEVATLLFVDYTRRQAVSYETNRNGEMDIVEKINVGQKVTYECSCLPNQNTALVKSTKQ